MVSYRRILLKLSGEALSGNSQNIDTEMLKKVVKTAQEIEKTTFKEKTNDKTATWLLKTA